MKLELNAMYRSLHATRGQQPQRSREKGGRGNADRKKRFLMPRVMTQRFPSPTNRCSESLNDLHHTGDLIPLGGGAQQDE
jgi:hypothetical protein